MVGKSTSRNFTMCKALVLTVLIVTGLVLVRHAETAVPQVARDAVVTSELS